MASTTTILLLLLLLPPLASPHPDCTPSTPNPCTDKTKSLPLKLIAIFSILVTSMIGVGAPLLTRHIRALNPDRNLFVIVKAFAAGIILATGFMHVLPDSFEMLSSSCLGDSVWREFPFSGFVAMVSAVGTLMGDSLATSFYARRLERSGVVIPETEREMVEMGHGHGHGVGDHVIESKAASQLLRYRVIAMV